MVELPTLGRAELLLGEDWSQLVVAEFKPPLATASERPQNPQSPSRCLMH